MNLRKIILEELDGLNWIKNYEVTYNQDNPPKIGDTVEITHIDDDWTGSVPEKYPIVGKVRGVQEDFFQIDIEGDDLPLNVPMNYTRSHDDDLGPLKYGIVIKPIK